MTLSQSSLPVSSLAVFAHRAWPLALAGSIVAASCSDEQPAGGGGGGDRAAAGSGGQAMPTAGSSMGGAAGMATTGGSGGMAMAMGGAGGLPMGGAGGMAMGMGGSPLASGGGTGVLQVLSDDATALRVPTTAAIVQDTVWVAIGQLDQLFSATPAPSLPFQAISIPLAGGPVGEATIQLGNDADFYLEGITAGPAGELYLGALVRGQIAQVAAGTTFARPFMDAGLAERGVVGMAVDSDRDMLWYCDSNPVAAVPGGAVVGVSTAAGSTGSELVRHRLPVHLVGASSPIGAAQDAGVADAGGPAPTSQDAGVAQELAPFCNDVIVLSGGDLLLTESTGRIFRVASASVLQPDSADLWLSDNAIAPPAVGGFGANGLDLVGSSLIVANSDAGELVQIDPDSADPSSTIRRLVLTEDGAEVSLCGPDGLATVPGSSNQLVVVENGLCAEGRPRVVKVTLDLE